MIVDGTFATLRPFARLCLPGTSDFRSIFGSFSILFQFGASYLSPRCGLRAYRLRASAAESPFTKFTPVIYNTFAARLLEGRLKSRYLLLCAGCGVAGSVWPRHTVFTMDRACRILEGMGVEVEFFSFPNRMNSFCIYLPELCGVSSLIYTYLYIYIYT